MFKECSMCGARIVMGQIVVGHETFCSRKCLHFRKIPDFCAACSTQTTDESTGDVRSVNMIGTMLIGGWNECAKCHSIERLKCVSLVVPVIPLGRFKVKEFGATTRHRLISRRAKGSLMTPAIWTTLAWYAGLSFVGTAAVIAWALHATR